MSTNTPIDVSPIASSSAKAKNKAPHTPTGKVSEKQQNSHTWPMPHYSVGDTPHQQASSEYRSTAANTYYVDSSQTAARPKNRAGGAVTIAAGGIIAAIGVPMLILPGPGLLAIGGGLALMAKGAKDLFGK